MQLKLYFGWRKSETAATYVKMSGRDLDDAILKAAGIDRPEKEQMRSKLSEMKICLRCHMPNEPTKITCLCGFSLDKNQNFKISDKRKTRLK